MAASRHTPSALLLLLVLLLREAARSISSSELREPHIEAADEAGYRTYIVQLERRAGQESIDYDARRAWHLSYLPSETTSRGEPRLLSSYSTVFTGFAAKLTPDELRQVSRKPGFVRSYPNVIYYLQTTRTPAFLGLPNRMKDAEQWPGRGGKGVIIGVVDGGIDDRHPSLGAVAELGQKIKGSHTNTPKI